MIPPNEPRQAVLCIVEERRDTQGSVISVTHHYYAGTRAHPNHGGPNGIDFTGDVMRAYRFACRAYAENFRGGVAELGGAKVIEL
jgi:hypothetical protein